MYEKRKRIKKYTCIICGASKSPEKLVEHMYQFHSEISSKDKDIWKKKFIKDIHQEICYKIKTKSIDNALKDYEIEAIKKELSSFPFFVKREVLMELVSYNDLKNYINENFSTKKISFKIFKKPKKKYIPAKKYKSQNGILPVKRTQQEAIKDVLQYKNKYLAIFNENPERYKLLIKKIKKVKTMKGISKVLRQYKIMDMGKNIESNKKKNKRIISIPMGGMNKKY